MNDVANNRLWRIQWSVRALAQSKSVVETLFPKFVSLADELALDFEESLAGVGKANIPLESRVENAVLELDMQLKQMSGPEKSDLWTDDALAQSAQWESVRSLALKVILLAGWPISPPVENEQIYIGPPR